uniref:Uncharacterized protein MANES_16G094000 n=3 Tax=Rhizophora mucronata TaxID=61149 RepID=A0A2P2KXM7_RHIMU
MKGGLYRFRGKEFSLFLIVLFCTTLLLCTWERIPLLTTLLPPAVVLPLSSDTQVEIPIVSSVQSGPHVHVNKEKDVATDESSYSSSSPAQREETGSVNEQILETEKEVIKENSTNSTETESSNKQSPEIDNNGAVEKNYQNVEEKYSKGEGKNVYLVAPVGSANASFSMRGQDEKNFIRTTENQVCNYAKGKWVIDNTRPLYSGSGCKQWLSEMWACQLTQRKDFAYERLRWQPKNCEMEAFEGSKFLKWMQHKTLAFVGDSLGRQQFQSLMCMITGGKQRYDVTDVGKEYGLVKPRRAVRPAGWAYHFPSTNTTVLYYWSACLCDLEPINITNPATDVAMHLDRPPAFLRQYLHKFDVLVLNTGHHWNRGKLDANRWVMFIGGKRNTNRKLAMIGGAKNLTIHSIVNWVNAQLPKHPHLKAFYRSISPRHYVNGDWNTGGSCDNTTPMSVEKEILQDESSDYSAGHAIKGTGVKILDITSLSQLRDEGHISRFSIRASPGVQDCLHWCLPGVPDTWNEILFAQIIDASRVQKE